VNSMVFLPDFAKAAMLLEAALLFNGANLAD
jgi:hypothetical protein